MAKAKDIKLETMVNVTPATDNQKKAFQELKREYDPHNQFFPMGFMSLD